MTLKEVIDRPVSNEEVDDFLRDFAKKEIIGRRLVEALRDEVGFQAGGLIPDKVEKIIIAADDIDAVNKYSGRGGWPISIFGNPKFMGMPVEYGPVCGDVQVVRKKGTER